MGGRMVCPCCNEILTERADYGWGEIGHPIHSEYHCVSCGWVGIWYKTAPRGKHLQTIFNPKENNEPSYYYDDEPDYDDSDYGLLLYESS